MVSLMSDDFKQEISTISDTKTGTAKHRFFMWETAYNMWLDHMWLGAGAGNVKFLIGQYQPDDFEGADYNERSWSGTTVHSMYFQALPELGIPGVLLMAYLAVNHFLSMIRIQRGIGRNRNLPPVTRNEIGAIAAGLGGAMAGFMTSGAFLSVAYYPYFWYLAGMGAALELALARELAGPQHELAAGEREPAASPA
jgi:O-antigen ligase